MMSIESIILKIKNSNYPWAFEIDWYGISTLDLSEEFIDKFANNLDWWNISKKRLSESFIEKHTDKVEWKRISIYQKLSEEFIERHKKFLDWDSISSFHKLSENFIMKNTELINWRLISKYQKLSESFILSNRNLLDWSYIAKHQDVSEEFIDAYCPKYKIYWLESFRRFDIKQIRNMVKATNKYECYDEYFIAYKTIFANGLSHFNNHYKYEVGGVYSCDSDYSRETNSYGIGVCTLEKAKYEIQEFDFNNEIIIKVMIKYDDVTRIVDNNDIIRVRLLEVLDIEHYENKYIL